MLEMGIASLLIGAISAGKANNDIAYMMGKKLGYYQASNEYEIKLLEQADEFIKQKRDFMKERDYYEQLLDEYEAEINNLLKKIDRTEQESTLLRELLIRELRLRQLDSAV